MNEWQRPIRCYQSSAPANRNKIADWYDGLSPEEKADADAFIALMRRTRDWRMPNYRPSLRGSKAARRLGELRWQSGKTQHRLIGYLQGDTFIALVGCTHKQQIYQPQDALETAIRRKKEIERREVNTVEYDL